MLKYKITLSSLLGLSPLSNSQLSLLPTGTKVSAVGVPVGELPGHTHAMLGW